MNKKFIQKTVLMGIIFLFIGSTLTILEINAVEPTFSTYTGTVKDTNGNSILDAFVRLLSNGNQVNTDETDSNGGYCVGNDIVTLGQIEVSKTGYYTQTKSVSERGGSYSFDLVAIPTYEHEPPKYTGTVKDTNGNSILDAFVRLLSNGNQVNTDETDSNGGYCVGNDVVTLGQIVVSKTGYKNQTKSVGEHGGENIDFTLSFITYIDISGQVTDNSGMELDGVYVILVDNEGSVIDRIETHDGGCYYFILPEENSLCTLYTYHTDYYGTEQSILLNTDQEINFEITLKPDRDNNIGQNFDNQAVSENPSSWLSTETDTNNIDIVNTVGNGLSNYISDYFPEGKLVKLSKSSILKTAIMEKCFGPHDFNLATTTLISFKAAFYSRLYSNYAEENPGNNGYFEIEFNNVATSPFKIEFKETNIFLNPSSSEPNMIHPSPVEKQLYLCDIVLEQDGDSEIDYNVYLDGELVKFGSFNRPKDTDISIAKLTFGVTAYSSVEFYVDNIHIEKPEIYLVENNLQYLIAEPLCWLYAPEVDGVTNQYKISYEKTTTLDISVSFSIPKIPFLSVSTSIVNIVLESERYVFGIQLRNGGNDLFLHVKHEFHYSKKVIRLKNSYSTYLETLFDFKYEKSLYDYLTQNDFTATYGWTPKDPKLNGLTSLKLHKHVGVENEPEVWLDDDTNSAKRSISISCSLGTFLKLGVSLTFSETITAVASIWVDLAKDIDIEYGIPIDHDAYLGIQPFVIRLNPNTDIPDSPVTPPNPELPPTNPDPDPIDPVRPDPITDPTPPPTKPPIPPFVR